MTRATIRTIQRRIILLLTACLTVKIIISTEAAPQCIDPAHFPGLLTPLSVADCRRLAEDVWTLDWGETVFQRTLPRDWHVREQVPQNWSTQSSEAEIGCMYNVTLTDDYVEETASNGDVATALDEIVELCMSDPMSMRPGYNRLGRHRALLVVMGGCYPHPSGSRTPECWTKWPFPGVAMKKPVEVS